MPRGSRLAILAAAFIALGSSPAGAAYVPGCANPADSALNQYCETIPAASGAHPPQVGAPALATALPSRIVRQLERGPAARQALLRLPAAHRIPKRANTTPNSPTRIAKASASTLPLWLILLLAGLALLMLAAAVARRRRRRAGPIGEPPA